MNSRLDDDVVQRSARVAESNSVVVHLELSADFAIDVQECQHVRLLGTFDKNVPVGRQSRGGPTGSFVAI